METPKEGPFHVYTRVTKHISRSPEFLGLWVGTRDPVLVLVEIPTPEVVPPRRGDLHTVTDLRKH